MTKIVRYITALLIFFVLFWVYNAIVIYRYSTSYSETKSEVAIVLGAGTKEGVLSAIFRERINHSIYLYKKGKVDYIIFTGGIGKNQKRADSEIAKSYAVTKGVDPDKILIDKTSTITFSNLTQAKNLMEITHLQTALLVSDPLHMKRSMAITKELEMKCYSSPTKTSMYQSWGTKWKSLTYESFFYSVGLILWRY